MRPNEALVTIVNGLHSDVQAAFWLRVNTIFVDPGARPLVARTLMEHRRSWGAIDLLVTMLHAVRGAVEPDVALVESALMSAASRTWKDIHKLIGGIQGPRTYLARITIDQTITEYWNCVIPGHSQQGIDVFDLDAEGRVVNQTVWLRPWPVVTIPRDAAIAG